MIELTTNPHAGLLEGSPGGAAPLEFHRRLPGYAPTPLSEAAGLRAALGLGRVWVKHETCRLGTPAFKMLGASWATYRALERRLGSPLGGWRTPTELRERLAPLGALTLAAATDGNHGRAVARMAALLGYAARIYVPEGTAEARVRAIESEGASVMVVPGSYDDAVALAAREDGGDCLVISDTAWPGYEDVPRDVIAGYGTIFAEADGQLAALGEPPPNLVIVQMGVGALAAAVARHYRRAGPGPHPAVVGLEPDQAACVMAAVRAGRIVEVPGPHRSIMAGLNAGLASPVAWPDVVGGVELFMALPDDMARRAMRALAADGVVAGETGAAGAAGLIALAEAPEAAGARISLSLGPETRALLLVTEGATDPAAYEAIVGRSAAPRCPSPGRCACALGAAALDPP
jgi:diaminopropionate ammonia-lyase